MCQVCSVNKAKIWPPLLVILRSPVHNDDALFTPQTRKPRRRKECSPGPLLLEEQIKTCQTDVSIFKGSHAESETRANARRVVITLRLFARMSGCQKYTSNSRGDCTNSRFVTTDFFFFYNAECRVFAEVDASLEHFLAISGHSVIPRGTHVVIWWPVFRVCLLFRCSKNYNAIKVKKRVYETHLEDFGFTLFDQTKDDLTSKVVACDGKTERYTSLREHADSIRDRQSTGTIFN